MLIETEIYLDYNPFDSSYENSKWVSVDVPLKKIAKVLAKRFGIETEQMHAILMSFDDYFDYGSYFEEDEEIQNLAQEYYNPEEDEDI